MLLDPGLDLTLRPMRYPLFYEKYKEAVKHNWSVDKISFDADLVDLRTKMSTAERHLVSRLVAFFATGDSIVGNNLVLSLYKHINSPEARMYLSRQLYEEAVHVDLYLLLLDNYLPDQAERAAAFAAIDNIPSIKTKGDFCFKWMDHVGHLDRLETKEHRRAFLLNLVCFASCVEGLFFFAAFAYVYFLRSKGLLHGLAYGTNYVFADETAHLNFAMDVIDMVRQEEPGLFDGKMALDIRQMLIDAVECETQFSQDVLGQGVAGLSLKDLRCYLEYVADCRMTRLGLEKIYGTKNPLDFMNLQDVQELTNFFERRVSAYQDGVTGVVVFDESF